MRHVPLVGVRAQRRNADLFEAVRASTVGLIATLDDEAMMRRGTANGKSITARALAWIIVGHAAHHEKVLRERYL